MTQKLYCLFWGFLFTLPLPIFAQVTLEMTYPTTDLHRVNWTSGGERYWYADDSLKQIKIFSAQHQLFKTIQYPSVPNAQVQLLQGDYGVSQTTIHPDNLLEMVWLIKDTVLMQFNLQIRNEADSLLFKVETPFDVVSFSEIEGLETPTLENICAWVAVKLRPRLPNLKRVSVARPSLGEMCTVEVGN